MRNIYTIAVILLVGFFWLMMFNSCDKGYIIPEVVEIPDTVSFSKDVIPIFEENCNSSGCHSMGGVPPDLTPQNAHLNLMLYGLVDTDNPKESTLYERLNSTSKPMPPTNKLSDAKIQLILKWIEQGALDN